MKYLITSFFTAIIFISCSNGSTNDENMDTANALNDTMPAQNPPVAIPLDSNPPDATYVDSMNNMSR